MNLNVRRETRLRLQFKKEKDNWRELTFLYKRR